MPPSSQHTCDSDQGGAPADATPGRASHRIDWRALRQADRACCCPGRPAVVAIMPPAPGRPYPVDLLLCRHHYRISARMLEAVAAGVFGIDGTPLPGTYQALARTGG